MLESDVASVIDDTSLLTNDIDLSHNCLSSRTTPTNKISTITTTVTPATATVSTVAASVINVLNQDEEDNSSYVEEQAIDSNDKLLVNNFKRAEDNLSDDSDEESEEIA
jgi:hypothetical protein